MVDVPLLVKAFGAFFAIMNPFVALPMFLSLTATQDLAHQRRTAVRVVLYSLIMAAILGFFGISVNHFRVAGGIVLGMIGLGMLNGGSSAHEGTPQEKARAQALATHSDDVAQHGSEEREGAVAGSATGSAAKAGRSRRRVPWLRRGRGRPLPLARRRMRPPMCPSIR